MAAVGKGPGATLAAAGLIGALGLGAPAAGAGQEKPDALAALVNEARAFEHGEGVTRDTDRARQLYCAAARRGNAEAQYSLGWMYANGRGMARDDALAAYLFALAARQGHAQARRLLDHLGPPPVRGPACLQGRDPEGQGAAALADGSPEIRKIADLVQRLAPLYGVDPQLALAVIATESNFNARAVSPRRAQGLMQLIPETSARFKVKRPFDPEENLRGGLSYLRWLLAYFRGDVALVAAAYNAGEGAVNRYRGIPPFAETQVYVKRIKRLFARDTHPYDQSVTAPSPELPNIRGRS